MNSLTTFEKAKAAADELFRANIKPSVNKIREKLDGKGGQQTIQDALDEWWKELNEQLMHYQQREDIPESLFVLTDQLWDAALLHAAKKHEQDCLGFKITKEQLQKQTEDEISRHKETKLTLDELRVEDETLKQKLEQALSETEALRHEYDAHVANYAVGKSKWESQRLELTLEAKDACLALEMATQRRKHEKELFDDRLTQEQGKFSDLKNQHNSVISSFEECKEIAANLTKEISDRVRELKGAHKTISELNDSIKTLDKTIHSHKSRIDKNESVIQERDKELLITQSTLNVSDSKLGLVEDALCEKTDLVRELNKQAAALTSIINDSKNDYKLVAAELDTIKVKYNQMKKSKKT